MAIPAALSLKEPRVYLATHVHTVKQMLTDIRKALTVDINLRTSILLSAITGTATLTFAWLVQPYFKAIGLQVEFFGIMWTALNLSVGVSSAFAFVVAGKLRRRYEVLIIIILLTAGYVLSGLAITTAGLVFLFMFYLARGLATPIFKNYINSYSPNQMRATILSVRNLIIRILFAVIGPVLGWMTDVISLGSAFIFTGLIYFVASLLVSLPWLIQKQK